MELFNTPQERFDHLQALISVAIADGKFHERERTYIENLCTLYGVSAAEFNLDEVSKKMANPGALSRSMATFTCRSNKLILLQDLIAFSLVDGCYAPQEQKLLSQVTELLGIEPEKLAELERLNLQFVDVNKKLAQALEVMD